MTNTNHKQTYDVIVIGGGHAGTEAAAVAARMGAKTALVTKDTHTIGVMSCNPAIGGIGKGHIVKEIDALDGLMARAIDKAGILFSILNRKKGPAVQGPRAQADRKLYAKIIQQFIGFQENLTVIAGRVDDFLEVAPLSTGNSPYKIEGIVLANGAVLKAKAVVLTTGTFLRGKIYRGNEVFSAGRLGEDSVDKLSRRLQHWQLPLSRLRTGTPPRLDGRTIDWNACEQQLGDTPPTAFSLRTPFLDVEQIVCGITYTNHHTHAIIRENLSLSAGVSEAVTGKAPRYCPSIEDKIVRFAGKDRHQVFLEPEGRNDHTVYPNGIANSLPEDVQLAFLRTMKGLEKVAMLEAGYTIEYDYVDPRALRLNLAVRAVEGLFFAGQINGTTGYEEAGGQGILAGINAALFAKDGSEKIFFRTDSYIGVMVDDLVSRGVSEPYRMFTARAEHRLLLRSDNADQRLSPIAMEVGCLGIEMQHLWQTKKEQLAKARQFLQKHCYSPQELRRLGIRVKENGVRRSLGSLLSLDGIHFHGLSTYFPKHAETLSHFSQEVGNTLTIDFCYKDYITRQEKDVARYHEEEGRLLPNNFVYDNVVGLSNEVKEKLYKNRPHSLGAASKIEGVTPAALLMILHALEKQKAL